MWVLQAILLVLKLFPYFTSAVSWGSGSTFTGQRTFLYLGFGLSLSWWVVFIPAYLIIIRYLLNRWLTKEQRI